VERLATRVGRERPFGAVIGDGLGRGFVGSFSAHRFNIRRVTVLPKVYALQAFGDIHEWDGGCTLTVSFRRNRLAAAALWAQAILAAFLVLGGLVVGLLYPAFIPFAGLAAVIAGLLLWRARERREDIAALGAMLVETFPDADTESSAALDRGGRELA